MAQISKEEERLARILAAKGETKNEAHVQSLLAARRKQEEEEFSLARYKATPVGDASLSSGFEGTQLFRKYASGQPASKSDSGGKEKQIFSKYKLNETASELNQKDRRTDNKPAPPRAKEDAQKEVSAGTAAFRHYASAQPMRMVDASGDETQMLAKYVAPSIEEEQKHWQQKMRREEEQKKQEEVCRRQEAAEKEISGTVLFRHYASAQPMKKEQEASAGEELELFARYGRVEPVEEEGDSGGNEDAKNNKKEERRKSWDSGSGIKSRSASGSTPKADENNKEKAGEKNQKTEKEEVELQQQQLKQHQRKASLEKGWTGAPRKDPASSPSTSSTAPAFKALVSPRRTNFEKQFYDAFQGTVIADDKGKQEDVLAKYKISGNEKDGAEQGAERREEKPVVRSEGSFFRKFSGAATTEAEAKNAREEAAMNQALDKYRINK
ncbi:hypothetical protein QOT17_010593 [Balamuthia mandrillaris]